MAIIPQDMDQVWRVAKAVYLGGLAPAALIGKKTGDEAISAVSVCIMSGAELGLKPMVSLRSFTVINGKPALYGDGLINVVRQSGKVAFLKTGHEMRDGQMVGYCHAKRNDTGEESRVEFTQAEAERAGLWDDRPLVRKQVWEGGQRVWKDGQPNDAPWYRYPQRMIAWRAAGYCLRELFGDVLGGIRDEFEAREISDVEEMRDITPPTPPAPPKPPAPPSSTKQTEKAEPAIDHVADSIDADQPEEAVTIDGEILGPDDGGEEFDATGFFEALEAELTQAATVEDLEEAWMARDPLAVFDGDDINIGIAKAIKNRALKNLRG